LALKQYIALQIEQSGSLNNRGDEELASKTSTKLATLERQI